MTILSCNAVITGVNTGNAISLSMLIGRIIEYDNKAKNYTHANPFDPDNATTEFVIVEAVRASTFAVAGHSDLEVELLKPFVNLDTLLTNRDQSLDSYQNNVEEKAKRDKVWTVIKHISNLVTYPAVLQWLMGGCQVINDNPLLFIFTLRNILGKIAFNTKLKAVLDHALHTKVDGGQMKWKEPSIGFDRAVYCLIGFNRLFSPRNGVGVSLSTDLDYKLVIDPSLIMVKINDTYVSLDDQTAKDKLEELIKYLTEQQESVQADFLAALMLLEVEFFTTKALQQFERDTVYDPINHLHKDSERNFAASMTNNHSLISGSATLFNLFDDVLAKAQLNVPLNTWTQYLGETDKGSITVIKNSKDLLAITNACACVLIQSEFLEDFMYDPARRVNWPTYYTRMTGKLWDASDLESKVHLSNPKFLKKVLGINAVKERLVELLEDPPADNPTFEAFLRRLVPTFFFTLKLTEELVNWKKDTNDQTLKKITLDGVDYFYSKEAVAVTNPKKGDEVKISVPLFAPLKLHDAIANLKIFESMKTKPLELIKRAVKLLASHIDDDNGQYLISDFHEGQFRVSESRMPYQYGSVIPSLCLVGTGFTFLMKDSYGWRFSLKYGLCRSNDFFDSVTKAEYEAKVTDKGTEKYEAIQGIAKVLNTFALDMQNAIYRMAILNPTFALWHDGIDKIYPRITWQQFAELMVSKAIDLPAILLKLKTGLTGSKEQCQGLGDLTSKLDAAAAQTKGIGDVVKQVRSGELTFTEKALQMYDEAVASLSTFFKVSNDPETRAKEVVKLDGSLFFLSLFNLVDSCAAVLKPPDEDNAAELDSIHLNLSPPAANLQSLSRDIRDMVERLEIMEARVDNLSRASSSSSRRVTARPPSSRRLRTVATTNTNRRRVVANSNSNNRNVSEEDRPYWC